MSRYSDPRWCLPDWHAHDSLEANLVLRGHGELLLEDRRYPLLPGHLVWLFPGQAHVPYHWSADMVMWIVDCSPKTVERAGRGRYRELVRPVKGQPYCRHVDEEQLYLLDALIGSVAETVLSRDTFNQGLQFALRALWDAFEEGEDASTTPVFHDSVKKVLDLLSEESERKLTGAQLARHAGLTPGHLSRLFHEDVGLTIPQYRNQQRLHRFLDLFEEDPASNLVHIALDAGFGSYAQFHRVFKQLMHCSPRDWITDRGQSTREP